MVARSTRTNDRQSPTSGCVVSPAAMADTAPRGGAVAEGPQLTAWCAS